MVEGKREDGIHDRGGESDRKGLQCRGSGRGGRFSISPTTILEFGKVAKWMDHFWVDDVGKRGTQGFFDGGRRGVCLSQHQNRE